jgi:UDP-N-acetylglucosamine 2-epimerase (non-hydrolysing)
VSSSVLVVVGARPNFVKVAPVLHALAGMADVTAEVLHTGQHYDRRLSDSFLEQLDFPATDHHLGVGSGTHAEQTAAVMVGVERVLLEGSYDAVLVPGDVNSTLAAALAASKLGVGVIHLEAGLRSRDWTMPEEINRVICDRVSDLLLVHSEEAISNLEAEGVARDRIAFVGNTIIDSLLRLLPIARGRGAAAGLGLEPGNYVLVTLHRPALVDVPERLAAVLDVLADVSAHCPVVLPVHPRTRARLDDAGLEVGGDVRLLEPLEYLDFIALQAEARLVVTDSGGVQEETSALGVPCITYRTTTERPVTLTHGTNELVDLDPEALAAACERRLSDAAAGPAPQIPLWDGHAGERAAEAIAAFLVARALRQDEKLRQ